MFQKILPNIYAFLSQTQGSNVYLIKDQTLALIDSSLTTNRTQLFASLNKLNILPKDIKLILHTHGHADHTSCSSFFENAKLRMHEFDAKHVNSKDSKFTYSELFQENHSPKISSYFEENEIISLGNTNLKVLFTPGHTAGSVCFYEGKHKLLFSGDTLFNNAVGRTDLHSSSSEQLKNSLQKLSKLQIEFLLPGHGPILSGTKENKKNIERMLEFV